MTKKLSRWLLDVAQFACSRMKSTSHILTTQANIFNLVRWESEVPINS